jgi:hypothetical protein
MLLPPHRCPSRLQQQQQWGSALMRLWHRSTADTTPRRHNYTKNILQESATRCTTNSLQFVET